MLRGVEVTEAGEAGRSRWPRRCLRSRAPAAPAAPAAPTPPVVVVAEAEAAPNLVRSSGGAPGPVDRREAARLEILRALERGDLDIEDASHKLEILEDAGPRYFRGWC